MGKAENGGGIISMSDAQQLNKWRLILGKYAKNQISFEGSFQLEKNSESGESLEIMEPKDQISYMDMEDLLDYLYSKEYGDDIRKEGGSGGTNLTVANWITKIRT